jgi:hypothetical protein
METIASRRSHLLPQSVSFAATLLVLAAPEGAAGVQARFFGLGDLPGGLTISYAYSVSGDGEVIAGESFSAISAVHGEGAHWRRVSPTSWQLTGIGLPATDALNSPAAGPSTDGGAIVGRVSYTTPTAPTIDTKAYIWRPWTGFQLLDMPRSYDVAAALGADKHAHVVVGWGGINPSYNGAHALVWQRKGQTWDWDILEPAYESQAVRVDPHGRIVIGWGNSTLVAGSREALCWVRGNQGAFQRRWLGALPATAFHSQAAGVARVGPEWVIVGFSGDFFTPTLPVVWRVRGTQLLAMAELPLLPLTTNGSANAISETGSRIVGNCWDEDYNFYACVWDWSPSTSTWVVSDLQALLNGYGVTDANGWFLWSVTGVSRDGTVICGSGTNPALEDSGWAVDLP